MLCWADRLKGNLPLLDVDTPDYYLLCPHKSSLIADFVLRGSKDKDQVISELKNSDVLFLTYNSTRKILDMISVSVQV